jgi:hypothetical protein
VIQWNVFGKSQLNQLSKSALYFMFDSCIKDSLYVEKIPSGQDGSGPVTLERKANQ